MLSWHLAAGVGACSLQAPVACSPVPCHASLS